MGNELIKDTVSVQEQDGVAGRENIVTVHVWTPHDVATDRVLDRAIQAIRQHSEYSDADRFNLEFALDEWHSKRSQYIHDDGTAYATTLTDVSPTIVQLDRLVQMLADYCGVPTNGVAEIKTCGE